MCQIGSDIHTGVTSDCQKGSDSLNRKSDRTGVQKLNLMAAPRTWFHWNGSDYNVSAVPANIFDAWIRDYVEEIEDVDTAVWEIFQRWEIINVVIKGRLLMLQQREDGSQMLEAFSSTMDSDSEEKASDLNDDESASQAV